MPVNLLTSLESGHTNGLPESPSTVFLFSPQPRECALASVTKPDSELFILFAENSQILLKIYVIPILLTFMNLVALNLLVNNQLNSSLWHKIDHML
jgi:hypothetical protein